MSLNSSKTRVVFSVTNCICHDQRVLKIAEKVSILGCDVLIVGRKRGECCNNDSVPFKTSRFRMMFKKGFLFYAFFNIRLFIYLLFRHSDLLVANDLDTLLPNYLVSKLRKLPLVYDSHEYFTGVPEIQNRPFVKWVWKNIEKLVFPNLKYVMTVSDSIAKQYEEEYRVNVITVRNCSRITEAIFPFSREELDLNPDHLLLILQGTGINIDRGGEELIEAIGLTDGVSLLIVGSGDRYKYLKEMTEDSGLGEKIRFIPAVSWDILMKYTKSADAGLSLDNSTNLNYRFSLPNKLFDYISAGIPIIATDLPEVSKILKEYTCGLLITRPDPEEISIVVKKLRDDKVLLSELKHNSVIASKSINWEKESQKVKDLYNSIIIDF